MAGNFWSGKPAARKKNILSRLAKMLNLVKTMMSDYLSLMPLIFFLHVIDEQSAKISPTFRLLWY
jgi:hypothetical protein